MKRSGVFWYGLIVSVLSFIAVAGSDDGPLTPVTIFDGLFAVAVNFLIFVVPVILIRNHRAKKRARHAG